MQNCEHLIIIIAKVLDIFPHEIHENSYFSKLKNWDSLSALRLMTTVEQEFGSKMPIYKFLKANTVKDLMQLVELG